MKQQKQGISFVTAALILLFGVGSFVGVANVYNDNHFGSSVAQGKDGEDSGDDDKDDEEDDKDDEEDDKDDDKQKSESDKKKSEKAREDAKKQAERTREINKKSMEQSGRGGNDEVEDENEDESSDDLEDDEEDDEEDELDDDKSGSFSGMYKEKDKTLSKLQEELMDAEEDIMKQQAKGADVTMALASLAAAKASIGQVGTAFDTNNLEMAKTLAKQIKKAAHFAEKDAKDAEHVAKELADVTKRFGQVEEKIAKLEAIGGDATSFKSQLASLRADFATLQASVSAGVVTRDTAKAFEKRVKRLKSAVETAIFALGGTDDDDLFEDHEDDANELSDDLNDVAEIEDGDDNGVSGKLRRVALEHKSSVATVATTLGDIKRRDGFARTLLGPDFNALDRLNTEVTSMNTRAAAIESAAAQIADPEMKQILLNQATTLRSEVTKLQSYITAEDGQFSILGGLMKLFR